MTPLRRPARFSITFSLTLCAAVAMAACSDRVIAPTEPQLRSFDATAYHRSDNDYDHDDDDDNDHDDCDRGDHHHGGHGGGHGCSKERVAVTVLTALQPSGGATINVTTSHPNGTSIEKIKVKLYNERGRRVATLEFNIPRNSGTASVTIPASKGVQPGWKAKVKVQVKTCKGKTTRKILRRVTFGPPAPTLGPPDLSVAPILIAAPIPTNDTPLEDAQIGVAVQYDVAVSNAPNARATTASCQVLVDGVALPAGAVIWVDANGNTISTGQNLLMPTNSVAFCRFTVTHSTAGPHTLSVNVSAVGGGETNLTNNSTSAAINVLAPGNDPLVLFQWNLLQREAVTVSLAGGTPTVVSRGILAQTATITTHWTEPTTDVPGTDTWAFTVTSSTPEGTFDARTGTGTLPRFTRSMIEAAPSGIACQDLAPSAPSTVRGYLTSTVQLCAELDLVDPATTTMRLEYVVNSGAYEADAPYNESDLLLWDSQFSFSGEVTHTGVSGTPNTFGGGTKTITLPPPIFEIEDVLGNPLAGPNVRRISYTQPPT